MHATRKTLTALFFALVALLGTISLSSTPDQPLADGGDSTKTTTGG